MRNGENFADFCPWELGEAQFLPAKKVQIHTFSVYKEGKQWPNCHYYLEPFDI